jgi:hypothetical protein
MLNAKVDFGFELHFASAFNFSLQPSQLVSRADFKRAPRDWVVVGWLIGK